MRHRTLTALAVTGATLILGAGIWPVLHAAPMPSPKGPAVSAWGDSLTAGATGGIEGGYPYKLSVLLGGRTVNNFGVSGQTSAAIAAREGALVAKLTLADNQLRAQGETPVVADNQVPVLGAGIGAIHGTIGRVAGTLQRDDNGHLRFVRDNPGAPLAVPAASPFMVDDHSGDITVIWAGRNDVNDGNVRDTVANIERMAARVKGQRFVIMGVTNGKGEARGTPKYRLVEQVNRALAARYPQNYLDIRSVVIAHYDPSREEDRADHGQDVPPASLRFDNQHFNPAGNEVVAQSLAAFIQAKGW